MRTRKHHNNNGLRQIKSGGAKQYVVSLANKLGITYSETHYCDCGKTTGFDDAHEMICPFCHRPKRR